MQFSLSWRHWYLHIFCWPNGPKFLSPGRSESASAGLGMCCENAERSEGPRFFKFVSPFFHRYRSPLGMCVKLSQGIPDFGVIGSFSLVIATVTKKGLMPGWIFVIT